MPVFPPPHNQPVSTPSQGDTPHQQLVGANKSVQQALETHVQPMRRGVVAANAALNTSADPQPTFPMAPNGQCMDLVNGDGVPLFPEIGYQSAVSTDSYNDANMAAPQPGDSSQQQYYQPRDPFGSGYIQTTPRQMPFVSYVHVDRGLGDDDYGLYPKVIWAPDGSILSSKPAPGYADPIVQGKRIRIRFPQDGLDSYNGAGNPNAQQGMRKDGGSTGNGLTPNLAQRAASAPKARSGLGKNLGDDAQSLGIDNGDVAPYGDTWDMATESSAIAIRTDATTPLYRSGPDVKIDGTSITKDPATGVLSASGGGGAIGKCAQISGVEPWFSTDPEFSPVLWETVVYDNAGFWDSGSPTILTVPVDGIYHIEAHIKGFFDDSTEVGPNIAVTIRCTPGGDHDERGYFPVATSGDFTCTDTTDIQLSAGSTVQVLLVTNLTGGDYVQLTGPCYLMIHGVG